MKPKFRNLIAAFAPLSRSSLIVCASLCAGTAAHAASQTWSATPTDANWATGTNWVGGAAPGVLYVSGNTINNDIATFNSAITTFGDSANPIQVDLGRHIGGITFDTANVGAYFIGGNPLRVNHNNAIQLTADVAAAQTINAEIAFRLPASTPGVFAFRNNATSSGSTLTFNGTVSSQSANTRPVALTLEGTNLGNNEIAGVLTHGAGQRIDLIKAGAGTWILSGINDLGSNTSGTNAGSVTINAGKLVVKNGSALSTNSAANALGVFVNSTGTLEITNGVTMDNGLSLNLASGGTILSTGSNATNGRINLTAVAANIATISAAGASDVFTIGNGANDLTGGLADTVITVGGLGTVFSTQASTGYLGQWSIGSGILKNGSATNGLGVNGIVTFANGSTGKLQLGNNLGLTSLTTNVGTPTAGIVEAGVAGTQTLTLTTASASEFAGTLQDGSGTLALTKAGAGVLTLSGSSNTYSGGTTISAGTLLATNGSGSATGTGSVAVNGGALAGTGTLTGAVTVASAATIAPGNGGIGTLSVGPLTLESGSKLDFDISSTASLDRVNTSGLLTINGGELTVNGGASTLATNGVYNLIGFSSISGSPTALTLNPLNKDLIFKTYTFGQSGGFLTLTVADSGVVVSYWNTNTDSTWSAGPWTTAAPNGISDFAIFGGGGTPITAPRTVTVDGSYTVGTLSFNNPSHAFTLADSLGANIILNNGAGGSFVTNTAGSHFIQAPITLTPNGATFSVVNSGDTLTDSGPISGDGGLTKIGSGTLALLGTNSYTGNTLITGGTIAINNANSLGDAASLTTIGAGTLLAKEDITSTRNFNLIDAASKISVDATKTYSISGAIGAGVGTLNKLGNGTLALSGFNSYSGGTVISEGTLNITSDAALGAIPGTPTPNLTLGNGTKLQAGGGLTLNANRVLVFNSGTETIDTQASNLILAGGSSGAGSLIKSGSGTLTLAAPQGYTGGTTVNQGTLQVNTGGGLVGDIALANSATFRMQSVGSNLLFIGNAINVAAGATVTFASSVTGNGYNGNVTSADNTSVILINSGAAAFNFSASNVKQLEGFLGKVHVVAGSSMDDRGTTVNNGGTSATFEIDGYVGSKNGGTWTFGTLTGASTGNLGGANTYTVGDAGQDSTYNGIISSTAGTGLIKNGSGKLTLTGLNTYAGNTVVNSGGTLILADNAQLTFRVGAGTTGNKISGFGSLRVAGDFNLDLNNPAALVNGTVWKLVDDTLSSPDSDPIFSPTFNIPGFTEVADVWTKNEGAVIWTFREDTKELSVAVAGYAAWEISTGLSALPSNNGPADDTDFDGIANQLEFVLGGNPLVSSTDVLPKLVSDPNNFIFTFNRQDVSYNEVALVFQSSPDLSVWTDVVIPAQTAGTVTVTPGSPSDVITVTIPKGANTTLFGRIKAVK